MKNIQVISFQGRCRCFMSPSSGNILQINFEDDLWKIFFRPQALTTPRIRKEIQESNETLAEIAKRYNINIKTVIKCKYRNSVADKKSGKIGNTTILTRTEEKIICKIWRHLKLSLDDLFIALKKTFQLFLRSNLYPP